MEQQINLYVVTRVLHDSQKLDRHLRPAAMSNCKNGVISIYAWRAHQSLLQQRLPYTEE